MARIAVEDGIHTMVAAPHCLNGIYLNWRKEILSACEGLNAELEANGIPLKILPGSEVRLSPEIMDAFTRGRLMTLNDTGRYFLLELPDQFVPQSIIDFIARLKERNVRPIITHPERNMAIQRNIQLLQDFISAGALSQITSRSLTGGFGPSTRRSCLRIIELNLARFMATDSHSLRARPPRLFQAVARLSTLTGKIHARKMVHDFPQAILEGRDLPAPFCLP